MEELLFGLITLAHPARQVYGNARCRQPSRCPKGITGTWCRIRKALTGC